MRQMSGETWDRVRQRLRSNLGEEVFSSWFQSAEWEGTHDGKAHLTVPTTFLRTWIRSHYQNRLEALWREEDDSVRSVDVRVRTAVRRSLAGQSAKPPAAKSASNQKVVRAEALRSPAVSSSTALSSSMTDMFEGSPLDPRLTFETFVVGGSNSLAHAAAKQIAEAPAGSRVTFNPLYINAPVGLGKTHLLQAIAWGSKCRAPERKVKYLTAERFMYQFVQSLRSQTTMTFKDLLHGIDLLLIDDLQFLQGKSIQTEFCHVLNALIDGAKQVVVASDRAPVALSALDDRVRSRLAGGLVASIEPMDADIRRSILNARIGAAQKQHPRLVIPDPILDYIAGVVSANGRDVDGAFNRILAHHQFDKTPITHEVVDRALKDLVRKGESKRIRIEDIQKIVSQHYNVTRQDMLSSRRTRAIVRPRQIAMHLAKVLTPRSLPEIGRRFGGRDHTTVLHAVRKIDALMKEDPALREELETLKRLISQ